MPGPRKGSRQLAGALRRAQARLARHLGGIGRAESVDVHQARVASRRIRSLLKTFRSNLDGPTVDAYRRHLRCVARELAPLRELDVLAGLPGSDNRPLREAVAGARRAEVQRLRRRLRAGAIRQAMAPGQPTTSALGLGPGLGKAVLERQVRRLWRRVATSLEAQPTASDDLHALRIELKNFRYALEAVRNPGDPKASALLAQLRVAQSLLGEENDLACAAVWLDHAPVTRTVARATLRGWQQRSRALAVRRPAVLERLRRAGRAWYRSTR